MTSLLRNGDFDANPIGTGWNEPFGPTIFDTPDEARSQPRIAVLGGLPNTHGRLESARFFVPSNAVSLTLELDVKVETGGNAMTSTLLGFDYVSELGPATHAGSITSAPVDWRHFVDVQTPDASLRGHLVSLRLDTVIVTALTDYLVDSASVIAKTCD